MMHFRKLQLSDEKAFLEAHHAFEKDFELSPGYTESTPFQDFVQRLEEHERGQNLPENWVPYTTLFALIRDKIIGRVMIRHKLTTSLRQLHGHIGYGVVPSERKKGYGTKLLAEGLRYAKTLSLDQVLLSCKQDNTASKKIIENAGGIFEKTSPIDPTYNLYWIDVQGKLPAHSTTTSG